MFSLILASGLLFADVDDYLWESPRHSIQEREARATKDRYFGLWPASIAAAGIAIGAGVFGAAALNKSAVQRREQAES
jgi:hypothetical protein